MSLVTLKRQLYINSVLSKSNLIPRINNDSQSSYLRPGVNEKRFKPGEGCYTPEIRRFEAEIQLAHLLIRYDLLDEARIALNRAGEKVKSAKRRYQIGALLVQLNELKSATRPFRTDF